MKLLKGLSSARGTKRALIASAACTLLCGLLLFSTSIAWFSADRKSGANELYSGNLDIGLSYSKDMANWHDVEGESNIFNNVNDQPMIWEPGAVNVVYFKIENKGNLAAKYDFALAIENEVEGKNFNEQEFKLSDYIKGGVVELTAESTAYATTAEGRTQARTDVESAYENNVKTLQQIHTGAPLITGKMDGIPVGVTPVEKQEKIFALVLYMPNTETNNEETNYKTGSPQPKISLKVKLVATQQNEESDSFGDTYDFNAKYPDGSSSPVMNVGSAESLKAAIAQFTGGSSIVLDKDIDLKNENWDTTAPWAASGTELVFDGNGHTIKNLKTTGDNGGLFGHLSSNGNITIKNLKIENVDLTGTNVDGESGGGALIGWSEVYGGTLTIENVTVTNVNIKDFKYIGGLVGYTSATNALNIKNCSVNGTELNCTYCENENNYKGHVGGLIGYYTAGTMSDCTVTNLTIAGSTTAKRAGALIGTAQKDAVVGSGNSINNVTINGTSVTVSTQVIGSVDNRTDKTTDVTIQ